MGYRIFESNSDYVAIKNTEFNDIIGIRNWKVEDKINFFKQAIKDEGLRNTNIIINIALLLKRLNNYDDTIFEREDIYFTSLVELVDVKLELKNELDELRKVIVKYYLSVIKSLVVKNEEQSKEIANLYYLLLRVLSVYDISLMLQKIDLDGIDAEFVKGADIIYKNMLENE